MNECSKSLPRHGRTGVTPVWVVCLLLLACTRIAAAAESLVNPFNDPFIQATDGLPGCPVPQPPTFTEEEYRAAAHERAQRGVSCWLDGRCRLANAYMYDKEIVPRVKTALKAAGRFDATSVWVLGQRRFVWLKGCVQTRAQASDIERLVREIDDVQQVHNELMIGTEGRPPYPVAPR